MSIRSAASSRASRRPASAYHAAAPSSHSSGSYFSSKSRTESILSGVTYTEPYEYGSYGSRSSDGGSEVLEEHHSTGPRASTHHQPHDESERIHSRMQVLEDKIARTRHKWADGKINPPDMLLRIANYRRILDMVATPDACRDSSLKLRVDEVHGKLKELEVEANIRRTREGDEMQDMARKDAERRENKKREESERQQRLMRERAAEKKRIRDEKEAKKKEKAEEEKQKRTEKEKKRKDHNAKFAAVMKEKKRLEKEENKKKEEQRIREGKKALEIRRRREKATRDRDDRRKASDKQAREAEEEARYQKRFTEEETRYVAKENLQKKVKKVLGGREEESRKRERERANAFAKKVMDDRKKKLKS
ncbi:hypothetical protein BOTNAR_0049g00030 [Botryotinia narcissicola]|uniref:Uncharacterized protein n=1 Tax=Botryotinia narcissicola TaxID=278944 RepID=A0A4Z1J066_9HELO|nr:hypothetical protein BOTNAR_0049g00030 [Botryotinia narcissicola]